MFTSVFGLSIKYEAWNLRSSLPIYITESYDFYTAYIGNKRCIVKSRCAYCGKEIETQMCIYMKNKNLYCTKTGRTGIRRKSIWNLKKLKRLSQKY